MNERENEMAKQLWIECPECNGCGKKTLPPTRSMITCGKCEGIGFVKYLDVRRWNELLSLSRTRPQGLTAEEKAEVEGYEKLAQSQCPDETEY